MNLNLTKSNQAGSISVEILVVLVLLMGLGIYIFGQIDADVGTLLSNVATDAADANISYDGSDTTT